jgi:dsRNA-specific ribonuclease
VTFGRKTDGNKKLIIQFDYTVHHGGVELGRGQCPMKKDDESAAALSALKSLRIREK